MSTQLNPQQQHAISDHLKLRRQISKAASDSKYARTIGITPSDYSNIVNKKWLKNPQLVSVEKWVRIARTINFNFDTRREWKTAPTEVTQYIIRQLETIQSESLTAIFCDIAGIGKTHTLREYAAVNANAFYVNCGTAPNKNRFISAIAQAVGLHLDGKYNEILHDVIFYLKSLNNPILIFDEAGDLENGAYLVLKRLYNELEFSCGMYLVGAQGMKRKIDSGVKLRKNGFEEVFSRFGAKYASIVPKSPKEAAEFLRREAIRICQANGIIEDEAINKIINAGGDLRRVRKEIIKQKLAA